MNLFNLKKFIKLYDIIIKQNIIFQRIFFKAFIERILNF